MLYNYEKLNLNDKFFSFLIICAFVLFLLQLLDDPVFKWQARE